MSFCQHFARKGAFLDAKEQILSLGQRAEREVGMARIKARFKAGFLGPLRASAASLRALARELFDPYRPELHYMRGPGPRWREKHSAAEFH